jgi:hypothetical protein
MYPIEKGWLRNHNWRSHPKTLKHVKTHIQIPLNLLEKEENSHQKSQKQPISQESPQKQVFTHRVFFSIGKIFLIHPTF